MTSFSFEIVLNNNGIKKIRNVDKKSSFEHQDRIVRKFFDWNSYNIKSCIAVVELDLDLRKRKMNEENLRA